MYPFYGVFQAWYIYLFLALGLTKIKNFNFKYYIFILRVLEITGLSCIVRYKVSFQNKYFIEKCFFKDFIYLFLERGREGEREGEKHQCVVASWVSPTGDLAHNPGMCPDWESNQ